MFLREKTHFYVKWRDKVVLVRLCVCIVHWYTLVYVCLCVWHQNLSIFLGVARGWGGEGVQPGWGLFPGDHPHMSDTTRTTLYNIILSSYYNTTRFSYNDLKVHHLYRDAVSVKQLRRNRILWFVKLDIVCNICNLNISCLFVCFFPNWKWCFD